MAKDAELASARKEKLGNVAVISIIIVSYGLFFYFQITTEFSTLRGIFESNRDQQILLTESTASQTGTKLGVMLNILAMLSQDDALGLLEDPSNSSLSEARRHFIAGGVETDLAVIDRQGILQVYSEERVTATNLFEYEWFQQAAIHHEVVLSGIYSIDEIQVFSIAYPFIDESGEYVGMVIATTGAGYIIDDYSSLESYSKEYIILDENLWVLASSNHEFADLFSGVLQEDNNGLQTMMQNLSAGSSGDIVYKTESEEILMTGHPVRVQDLTLFVVLASPTSTFYSQVEEVLFNHRIQMFSILTATSVLTVIIASFISRNIKLDKDVKEKTKELEESNAMIRAQKESIEKANRELMRLDEMKSQFISIASHELRNPIQPILLHAEMAAAGDIDKDKAIEVIIRQANRLKQLASDILDASRIDANNLTLNKQKIKIGDLISDIVNTNKVAAKPKVSFKVEIEENTEILADPVRIGQVLSNILQNSFKFTESGTITIQKRNIVVSGEKFVEIVVSDTVAGIPPEILPNLFNKFVTMDAGGKNKHGTGLGLYICKGIVAAHMGEISAYNNPEGGASVRIVLPINAKHDNSVKISQD